MVGTLPEGYKMDPSIYGVMKVLERHLKVTEEFFTNNSGYIVEASQVCADALQSGKKILLAGNGGSAADAQHIAAEFVGRFIDDRKALPAIALTTDTSILTAVGNDYGYEYVFSRQIEGLGQEGDIFIAISTSGNSENIIKAIEAAKQEGLTVIGLTGKSGGRMRGMCDVFLCVEDEETAHVQECHIMVMHMLCGMIETSMGFSKVEIQNDNVIQQQEKTA